MRQTLELRLLQTLSQELVWGLHQRQELSRCQSRQRLALSPRQSSGLRHLRPLQRLAWMVLPHRRQHLEMRELQNLLHV